MARNNIGEYYKYNRIVETMRRMGAAKLCNVVNAEQILPELKCHFPGLFIANNGQKGELAYIKATFRDYRTGQQRNPRSRKPMLFESLGKGLWTLAEPIDVSDFTELGEIGADHEPDSASIKNSKEQVDSRVLSAIEGSPIERTHLVRERGKLAKEFKGQLSDFRCEVCGFDFEERYGIDGRGCIEAHHALPLCTGRRRTRLEDFRAVCSNCHTMLHRERTRTISELQMLLRSEKA